MSADACIVCGKPVQALFAHPICSDACLEKFTGQKLVNGKLQEPVRKRKPRPERLCARCGHARHLSRGPYCRPAGNPLARVVCGCAGFVRMTSRGKALEYRRSELGQARALLRFLRDHYAPSDPSFYPEEHREVLYRIEEELRRDSLERDP